MKKKIIYGCDSRGDGDSPYLTRWTLIGCKLFAVYLHRFHRSDADEHHDHPWAFCSVILKGGYFEETSRFVRRETRSGTVAEMEALMDADEGWQWGGYSVGDSAQVYRDERETSRKLVRPGMILFRRATHRHRVVLRIVRSSDTAELQTVEAWTLIIRGPYVREWGFFTKKGWQNWRDYFKERGC